MYVFFYMLTFFFLSSSSSVHVHYWCINVWFLYLSAYLFLFAYRINSVQRSRTTKKPSMKTFLFKERWWWWTCGFFISIISVFLFVFASKEKIFNKKSSVVLGLPLRLCSCQSSSSILMLCDPLYWNSSDLSFFSARSSSENSLKNCELFAMYIRECTVIEPVYFFVVFDLSTPRNM